MDKHLANLRKLEIIFLDSLTIKYLVTISSFQTQESANPAFSNKVSITIFSEIKVPLIASSFLAVSCYFYINPVYLKQTVLFEVPDETISKVTNWRNTRSTS